MALYNNYWLIVDLETGGFSAEKNPVTEVAMVVLDCELNIVKEYSSLIKPYGDLVLSKEALQVTGLSIEELNTGKDVKQVVDELIEITKSLKIGKFIKPILVGHNFEDFDRPFFESIFTFCKKNVYETISKHIEDTLWISRKRWGIDNLNADFKLGTCCVRDGIDLVQAHRALADTRATAKLFVYLMKSLRGEGIQKVEEKKVRETFKF